MSRSIRVAKEHIQRVKVALRRHGFPSQKALAEELGISRSTTDKFFTGKPTDYSYFVEISQRLGLDWQAIAYIQDDPPLQSELTLPSDEPQASPEDSFRLDWQQACRAMLKAQNQGRLTTNPFTTRDGVAFELDEIYVPLGLVKRKQRDRRSYDVSPEQGSRVYEPEAPDEIIQTFQQDQFFEQVLRLGKSKRIAIIGEPGAGKTTLLQKIAAWVLDNTKDVPIWISLADLQGKSIEQYLLEDWLKATTRKFRVTEVIQEALGTLFNSGRVWLLLDAVDEMAVRTTTGGIPLQAIANQLTGWVGDAKVVLTCRLNVWDAGKNALEAFDTYRNLDFSYGDAQTPDQVGQFIHRWFKDNLELAKRLRTQLNQPGKERIKDTVKNPLRLALLCRTWALGQGGLPNTKSGLYQQFTEALYEWKQERFFTTCTQRQELNQALGELAKRALSQEKTKFRLRHRLVCSVLGQPDADLFELALQLGWLNQVGVATEAENLGEKIYAFYHPTFQEYFAAQAISDWHYFLNHIPNNPAQGTYRIFESQWKEVILLWLGREDVPDEQKEEFINALVELEDGCKNFYKDRAYFLAATAIAEFGNCSRASEIVEQIVKWSFGDFKVDKQLRQIFLKPIEEGARVTLLETNRSRAIAMLMQLIKLTEDDNIRRLVAESLGQIDPSNQIALTALVEVIKSTRNESIRKQAADSLGNIGTGNQTAITALIEVIKLTEYEVIRQQAADSLAEIGQGNPIAITELAQLIESTQDEDIHWQAAEILGKIGSGNQTAIAVLVQLIESTKDEDTCRQAAESLGKIDTGNETALAALVQIIESTEYEYIRQQAAKSLGKIDPGNETALATLVQIIESTDYNSTRRETAESLGEISMGNPEAIAALVQLVESTQDKYIRRLTAESLGKIGSGNQTVIGALVQLIELTQDEDTRILSAESLGKIGSGNQTAIAALAQLIESTQDEFTRRIAAESLGKIGYSNPEAIAALMQLIESTENDFTRREAADSLGKIDPTNQTAITALLQVIKSTQNNFTRRLAAESLGKISSSNPEAITALVQLTESSEYEYIRQQATEILGKIGTGHPSVIAALIRLIESTQDKSTRWQAADTLGEIALENKTALAALVQLIESAEDEFICKGAAENLKKIFQDEQLAGIVITLKDYLSDETYENDRKRFDECYKLIWHCAQNMNYPAFYQAWHTQTSPS